MKNVETMEDALRPEIWESVSRKLLAKMLSEFMYEEMIQPEKTGERDGLIAYRLPLKGGVEYTFEARERLFDSYRAVPESIVRAEAGEQTAATDPLRFILDLRETVGMDAKTASHFIKEMSSTLLADAHILVRKSDEVRELTELDYAHLEGEMEGHPWITFNKGRIGFGYDDYLIHAPERKKAVQLFWIAVAKDHAQFNAVRGLDHESLMKSELGEATFARFRDALVERGLDSEAYYFLPVHEWQWKNVIVPLFAADLASDSIVPLGEGPDLYLPQQSIRTFLNLTNPEKYSVKVPLSILNTLVYRGLPGDRTTVAPRVTEWIVGLRDSDPFLRDECRLILLGEVAGLNYDHPYHKDLPGTPYQHLEMLGCIWRESILRYTTPTEKPITLAALLHIDGRGKPFVSSLIEQSGLGAEAWLEKLFSVILPPLLHYLYRYGTVFSPHGENTILVLENGIPSRLAMKDFVDDVNISEHPVKELEALPEDLEPVLLKEPPEGLCQFILAGLFICHLRYLSDIFEEYYGYPENDFWSLARETILGYQESFPELEERYRVFDLLAPSFTKLCLNRNRMLDYGYADDDERPHASEFGQVANALHQVSVLPGLPPGKEA